MCVSSCFCVTQSEAIADDRHLFCEFLTFLLGSRRERKGAMDKKKDHGTVDKPFSE